MTRFSFALVRRSRLFHAQLGCVWGGGGGGASLQAGRSWLHHSPMWSSAMQTEEAKPADFDPSAFDPSECRSPPADKVLAIVEEIANLTLLEASDLSFLLKKKLGLPDHAMPYYGGSSVGTPTSSSTQGGQTAQEEKEPEKTSFDVKLEKFEPAAKIKVIKEVRAYTDLGLKEAKEMVEKTPVVFKKGVSKEEAEQIIEKLKAAGATCVLE